MFSELAAAGSNAEGRNKAGKLHMKVVQQYQFGDISKRFKHLST